MKVKTALKGPGGKRSRRGPQTRNQILDSSLRLFSERGFARTTVRAIARDAGITDAAIYYHFTSKRELLEALVEERGFVTRIQRLENASTDYPLRETLLWMARGAIDIMDENRGFLRLILLEGLVGDEVALDQYRRLVSRWEQGLVSVLRRYVEKGEMKGDDLETLARQIIYVILAAFEETLLGGRVPGEAEPQQRRAALAAFIARAIDQLMPAVRP